MIHCSTPDQIKACRAFALECNRQMFEDAQLLSRCAFEMLEDGDMDLERFERYRTMRRKADLKFQEAIEHLRLLNADFPPIPMSMNNSHRLRQQLEDRA
ncbi:hypothetical protein [Pseudomonas sp. NPDC099000]|uniref:hypothetical protein n=1 Tax=Pseudomonas sp. NPDC099000 TaxID=3364488 RepID=UPI00383A8DBF